MFVESTSRDGDTCDPPQQKGTAKCRTLQTVQKTTSLHPSTVCDQDVLISMSFLMPQAEKGNYITKFLQITLKRSAWKRAKSSDIFPFRYFLPRMARKALNPSNLK